MSVIKNDEIKCSTKMKNNKFTQSKVISKYLNCDKNI